VSILTTLLLLIYDVKPLCLATRNENIIFTQLLSLSKVLFGSCWKSENLCPLSSARSVTNARTSPALASILRKMTPAPPGRPPLLTIAFQSAAGSELQSQHTQQHQSNYFICKYCRRSYYCPGYSFSSLPAL
jgi:hypothetical protein